MSYKYSTIIKTFSYSKESYKIISDFLLSGQKSNPNILLNVTKISKEFGKLPNEWLRLSSTIAFAKSLIQIKLESKNEELTKAFEKFFIWLRGSSLVIQTDGSSRLLLVTKFYLVTLFGNFISIPAIK